MIVAILASRLPIESEKNEGEDLVHDQENVPDAQDLDHERGEEDRVRGLVIAGETVRDRVTGTGLRGSGPAEVRLFAGVIGLQTGTI